MDTDRVKAALEEAFKAGQSWAECYVLWFSPTETEDKERRESAVKQALSLLSAPSPVGQEARELANVLRILSIKYGDAAFCERAVEMIQSALDAAVAGERERVKAEVFDRIKCWYLRGQCGGRDGLENAIVGIKEAKR